MSTTIPEHDLLHSHAARVELIAALANWSALTDEQRDPIRETVEEVCTVEEVFDSILKTIKLCGFDVEVQAPADTTYLTGAYL